MAPPFISLPQRLHTVHAITIPHILDEETEAKGH